MVAVAALAAVAVVMESKMRWRPMAACFVTEARLCRGQIGTYAHTRILRHVRTARTGPSCTCWDFLSTERCAATFFESFSGKRVSYPCVFLAMSVRNINKFYVFTPLKIVNADPSQTNDHKSSLGERWRVETPLSYFPEPVRSYAPRKKFRY